MADFNSFLNFRRLSFKKAVHYYWPTIPVPSLWSSSRPCTVLRLVVLSPSRACWFIRSIVPGRIPPTTVACWRNYVECPRRFRDMGFVLMVDVYDFYNAYIVSVVPCGIPSAYLQGVHMPPTSPAPSEDQDSQHDQQPIDQPMQYGG